MISKIIYQFYFYFNIKILEKFNKWLQNSVSNDWPISGIIVKYSSLVEIGGQLISKDRDD